MKILKMKKVCYFHGYSAMISIENLEDQTFLKIISAVSNRWTGLWTGSVDWIAGLDCWTGLLDPTKLPVKVMMHV